QSICEMECVAGRLRLDHRHAITRALALQTRDERWRHVMRMDVDHRGAPAIQRARFDAESGSSRTTARVDASAAATAFAAAAPVATMPPSPAPLAPSGFDVDGASCSVMLSMCGKSAAVGSA